jgi:RNA polymerase sigma factor (sigma-70 family)
MQHSAVMNADVSRQFAALLHDHQALVFKVARIYAYNSHDRDDLAQEIAVQLWRAFPRYDTARRFSTWAYRVALNVAISWVREEAPRRRRSVAYEEQLHEPAVSEDLDASDGDRILRVFIETQSPLDRALLLLYLEERPYAEISEILGITTTNLTTRISRLKERLTNFAEQEHGTR